MGYSCTAAASYTLDAIDRALDATNPVRRCSNETPDGGFYERGREQPDGAITGTVWKPCGDGRVVKRGSFKINADGTVTRFPGLPGAMLRAAESAGAAEYQRRHAPPPNDWRARGVRLAAFLRGDGATLAADCWNDFQAVFSGWQRDARVMFACMPACTAAAMTAWLDEFCTG